jgi:hypothetical protein
LLQLIDYHTQNIDKKLAYIEKPHYQDTAMEKPKQYWRFAILNVLRIIRWKKEHSDKGRKQFQIDMLTEMMIRKG